MPTEQLFTDDLLDPISADQPAGVDLRWTLEWDRIKEARRADDSHDPGKWAKRDQKSADWPAVRELTTKALRERSKDLQLALWLTEANIRLHGFAGFRDGLRITRELMVRYWDQGLYPAMEDGPEDRAGPFEWLNNKLVDYIAEIPITARNDRGEDYGFLQQQDARNTGSESSYKTPDGDIDSKKKKVFDTQLAEGHISLDMFERAIQATRRAAFEELSADFQDAYFEFKTLEQVVDERFGDVAPNLSQCRTTLNEIRLVISDLLVRKRQEEPDPVPVTAGVEDKGGAETGADGANPMVMRIPLTLHEMPESSANGSWQEAESLIRAGQVEKGLGEMTRLAAGETSGRSRFQRKLLLAEVCLGSNRERLARSILEELAEQIDKLQLEAWESTELISCVWTRLYHLYKRSGEGSDSERADKLYERLCRLDPWQALGCRD